MAEVCQGIHDVANSLVANLAPYGVVPAELTAHQTVIDAYVTAVSAPRTAAIMRKGATSELTVMATKSMRILTNRMDKMMREFQTSDPVFYQEYFDARIIVDAGAAKKNVKKAADPNAKAA